MIPVYYAPKILMMFGISVVGIMASIPMKIVTLKIERISIRLIAMIVAMRKTIPTKISYLTLPAAPGE
ncbi:MAG: hypothetical protein U0164_01875 [Gemmatimonadaceae bacterium]